MFEDVSEDHELRPEGSFIGELVEDVQSVANQHAIQDKRGCGRSRRVRLDSPDNQLGVGQLQVMSECAFGAAYVENWPLDVRGKEIEQTPTGSPIGFLA